MTQRFLTSEKTVAFLEESHLLPLVSIVIAIRIPWIGMQEGLALMTARMLRRGCARLSSIRTEEAIDQLGGELSIHASPTFLHIHVQVISRNVEAFIDLLGEIIRTPLFLKEEFEKLKKETLAEIIEGRDHDRHLAQLAFYQGLFGDHPYGKSSLGSHGSVESFHIETIRAFFKQHFIPENIILGFAGDLSEKQAHTYSAKLLSGLPKMSIEQAPFSHSDPELPFHGRKLILVDKPERTQTQILIGTFGTSPHDSDHTALLVANGIFGGTFTSRLMREIRSKRGWSYGASSYLEIDQCRHAFWMGTFPASTDAAACIALQLQMYASFLENGVSRREVEFIKRYLLRSRVFDIDTPSKRLSQALSVELLKLPPTYYSDYPKRVKAITAEQTNEAIRLRLSASDLLITVVGTAQEILQPIQEATAPLSQCTILPFTSV
ncbi:M16 family metallopeptidase [Pajaroellobacter abortibovis]|uniref:Peptidase M16 C-terminal domain-containing protein n=1 Tax=Pajaroellobacter abortibovis TaxID=1882918 RepID=A0A1L6MWT5_9BACT|nr:pitrilysin family protein [Pajaroellobacter abortibovis]APR99981.1 hypothetical protein BCY86_04255 [Pajaroellobacter abortibovis]